jgi:hypothetical protein
LLYALVFSEKIERRLGGFGRALNWRTTLGGWREARWNLPQRLSWALFRPAKNFVESSSGRPSDAL